MLGEVPVCEGVCESSCVGILGQTETLGGCSSVTLVFVWSGAVTQVKQCPQCGLKPALSKLER